MQPVPPTGTPAFCAVGELTGSEIWMASTLPILISGLIDDPEYASRDRTGQLLQRERFACELATQTAAGLLLAAITAGTFSWEGASLEEIDRLTRAREIADREGHWPGSVPLILVKPRGVWKSPTGRVKVISPATDSVLLLGMRQLGWLTEVTRMDSAGGIGAK